MLSIQRLFLWIFSIWSVLASLLNLKGFFFFCNFSKFVIRCYLLLEIFLNPFYHPFCLHSKVRWSSLQVFCPTVYLLLANISKDATQTSFHFFYLLVGCSMLIGCSTLVGCSTVNFRLLSRGQPHSPDYNHCILSLFRPKGHRKQCIECHNSISGQNSHFRKEVMTVS